MKSPSKKLGRPTIRTPKEDPDPVGVARMFVEVDAGTGHGVDVTVDLKIAFRPGSASGIAGVVRELDTSSAELSDELHPISSPTLRETDRTSSASSECQYQ
jgi:hypothetical protein